MFRIRLFCQHRSIASLALFLILACQVFSQHKFPFPPIRRIRTYLAFTSHISINSKLHDIFDVHPRRPVLRCCIIHESDIDRYNVYEFHHEVKRGFKRSEMLQVRSRILNETMSRLVLSRLVLSQNGIIELIQRSEFLLLYKIEFVDEQEKVTIASIKVRFNTEGTDLIKMVAVDMSIDTE